MSQVPVPIGYSDRHVRPTRLRHHTSVRRPPHPARGCPGAAFVHFTGWKDTYGDLVDPSFWEDRSLERSVEIWNRWIDADIPALVAETVSGGGTGGVGGGIIGIALATSSRESNGALPVRPLQLNQLYVLTHWHGTGVAQSLLEAARYHHQNQRNCGWLKETRAPSHSIVAMVLNPMARIHLEQSTEESRASAWFADLKAERICWWIASPGPLAP